MIVSWQPLMRAVYVPRAAVAGSPAAISDNELTVRIEAEEGSTTEESASTSSELATVQSFLTRIGHPCTIALAVVLLMRVKYTPAYPDELPELDIEVQEGSEGSDEDRITEEDKNTLLGRLRETVRPNGPLGWTDSFDPPWLTSLCRMLHRRARSHWE